MKTFIKILITKSKTNFLVALTLLCITSIYSQTFTEVGTIPFTATNDTTLKFADIDDDDDLDLLILGDDGSEFIAELYENDGGVFTLVAGTPFTGVERGDAVFGDVNGDTYLDVIISGDDGPGQITKLYTQNEVGVFTESTTHSFSGVRGHSALALGDVNGDDHLDLILSGWDGSTRVTELHTNDGTGTFTLDASAPFKNYDGGSIDFADVNGDTHLDVLLTGKELDSGNALSELYINNGTGTFTLDATATATIENVRSSDAQFADIDGDTDLDLIVSGWDESAGVTKLYTNESGVFTLHQTLEGFTTPRIDFADIDNDGDVDLFLSGKQATSELAETEIYINDAGTFTITTDALLGARSGDIEAEDIDGDGDADVLISGWDETSRNIKLYTNDLIVLSSGDVVNVNTLSVYPNPTSTGILQIDSEDSKQIDIQVLDRLGRVLIVSNSHNDNTLDISDLPSGVYFVKIESAEKSTIIKKIIKK